MSRRIQKDFRRRCNFTTAKHSISAQRCVLRIDRVQNCALGHVEKDADEYIKILDALHGEGVQKNDKLSPIRDVLETWTDAVNGLEQSKTNVVEKDLEKILS